MIGKELKTDSKMEYLKDKTIIVTGGNGFLGSSVLKRLESLGVSYTNVSSNYNLIIKDDVERLFIETKPHLIFHLAADCGGIAYNIKNPADLFYNNLIMTLNIFNAAVKFGSPKIIMIGSVDSYPGDIDMPYTEKDLWKGFPESTSAYYGLAKRMNIALGEAYFKQYNQSSIHILLMNLYGPNDHFDELNGHVIPAIIRKIDIAKQQKKSKIDIYGDGSPIREFVYVEDAADLIIKSAKLDGFEYFNMGSGQLHKIIDVLNIIKHKIGFDGEFVKDLSKPMGHPIKEFNSSKMNRLLGDYNFTLFEEGMNKTIEWYKKNC